jgi:calcium-dependent protein kinase
VYNTPARIDKGFIYECFRNILLYNPEQKFQQAALAYMVHHLTDNTELKDIRNIFLSFNTNNDGLLTFTEMIKGFSNIFSISDQERDFLKIMKKIDQDRSGYIEYEEFIRAVINKTNLLKEEKLDITFRLFDKDGSGSITPEELKDILGLNSKYNDKVWNEIINQIEHNKQNEVTYEEFKNMMFKFINA